MVRTKKEVMNHKIYLILKNMIGEYRFQPGVRLNVEKLARELGVSRTPVWEAVRRLEQDGVLKNIPQRGVFMVEMNLEKNLEIFIVRGFLDRLAGRLAVKNMNGRNLRKLKSLLEKQFQVVKKGDLIGYQRLNFEFHSLIYEMSGISFLQEIFNYIKTKMQPIYHQIMPILPNLYQDHMEILEAIRSKDAQRVEKIFTRHNERMLNQIRKEIETSMERKGLANLIKSKKNQRQRGSK